MKHIYSKLLLGAATVCLAAGPAMAEGYQKDSQNSQSYNSSIDQQSSVDSNASAGNQQANLAADDIQEVQSSLRSEGFAVAVDGVWGPQTSSAVRQFQ